MLREARRGRPLRVRQTFHPSSERLEERQLLSFLDSNGAVVTSLVEQGGPRLTAIVITFDGPLNRDSALNPANYAVNSLAPGNPEIITRSGPFDPITSISYDASKFQVTLNLLKPLVPGAF